MDLVILEGDMWPKTLAVMNLLMDWAAVTTTLLLTKSAMTGHTSLVLGVQRVSVHQLMSFYSNIIFVILCFVCSLF